MKKRIKIQGFLIFLAVAATILFSKFLLRSAHDILLVRFLDGIGAGLLLFGFLLRIAARGYKAEMSLESKRLVAGGPYRLVRNPMYLGTILIGSGIALLLFHWWVLLILLAVFLVIYIPQVRKEEAILSGRFKDEYSDYCKKVPRFIPGISAWFKADLRAALSFKRAWLKREISSLAWAVVFILAVKIWRQAGALRFFVVTIILSVIIFVIFYDKKDTAAKS